MSQNLYNPGGFRSVSNWMDKKFDMHENGWVRSSIHAAWHGGAGVAASVNAWKKSDGLFNPGDQSQAKRQFSRAKEQWDRVDNNKFGKTKN
ncbi:unnamed protein product [Symbiodinium sp. CCMP2592]|nr:unnamed protein product [Symbiodinium sp. CCMP2592]CAE7269614.1 unnamed protein product [Symbiodinium sp. CCMP2592]